MGSVAGPSIITTTELDFSGHPITTLTSTQSNAISQQDSGSKTSSSVEASSSVGSIVKSTPEPSPSSVETTTEASSTSTTNVASTSSTTTSSTASSTTTDTTALQKTSIHSTSSGSAVTFVSNYPATTSMPGSTSNNTSSPSSSRKGFSAGDVAGAAIGSAIGAALLTLLVAFLFLRRSRKSSQYAQPSARRDTMKGVGGKGYNGRVLESEKALPGSPTAIWPAYLPQSADDRTVQKAVKTLFDQIELHVDNYYQKKDVTVDGQARQGLAKMATSNLPGPLEKLICISHLTLPIIKHSMANAMIARISPADQSSKSLLMSCFAVAPPATHDPSKSSKELAARQQAYSVWKVLTAYLTPRPQDDERYSHRLNLAGDVIVGSFAAAFTLWYSHPEQVGEVQEHERSLVGQASNLGLLLMSQPSAYSFRWAAGEGDVSRTIVVMPGFWKTSDESGTQLKEPQMLVAPVLARY